MPATHLSLKSAILINLNIMIGSGLFINTVLLAQQSGPLSPLVYAILGVLIFPLIASFSQLLAYHPGGNFYDFASVMHPYAGFISLWSYFTTKLASAALGIHVCMSLMQTIFSSLNQVNILALDCLVITLFLLLNTLNMRLGTSIQSSFMLFKLLPITFVFISGFILFDSQNFIYTPLLYSTITSSIPFALYSLTGFESVCSLARAIKNPEKNGPLAILISFLIVLVTIILYQGIFYGNLGNELSTMPTYLDAFPTLIKKLFSSTSYTPSLQAILHSGIGVSALGVAYGIIYSNSWNLYSLAKKNLVFFPQHITYLSAHNIPTVCLAVQGFLMYSYIALTQGYQVPLQQLVALGCTTTYTLSCLGLCVYIYQEKKTVELIPILGLLSCCMFIATLFKSFSSFGIQYFFYFLVLLIMGSLMFFIQKNILSNES